MKSKTAGNYRLLYKGTSFYRYNLGTDLPEKWDKTYRSSEYVESEYGPKNQIGALFFYLDEKTAQQVLDAAKTNYLNKGLEYVKNTITTCNLMNDVRLLDISQCCFPMCVLRILHDEGIDVLNDGFVKHDHGDYSFSELKEDFEKVITNDGIVLFSNKGLEIIEAANRINDFFYQKQTGTQYIGQLLTDFENGKYFKKQLCEKGYDGYCFTEEPSPTICLFDSAKLNEPKHKIIG